MSIIPKLATSLNRRDEVPNQELAKMIVKNNDKKAVQELSDNLGNKDKGIQSDCIKVIYEIAGQKPQLIAGYAKELIELLGTKNNRLQWGAMIALHAITGEDPKTIYKALSKIIDVADKGSVITNDHCVGILIKLAPIKEFASNAFSLLNEHLKKCPTNQLPMYAERALPIVNEQNKITFIKTLTSRLSDIERDSGRARVEKVIKKVQK